MSATVSDQVKAATDAINDAAVRLESDRQMILTHLNDMQAKIDALTAGQTVDQATIDGLSNSVTNLANVVGAVDSVAGTA